MKRIALSAVILALLGGVLFKVVGAGRAQGRGRCRGGRTRGLGARRGDLLRKPQRRHRSHPEGREARLAQREVLAHHGRGAVVRRPVRRHRADGQDARAGEHPRRQGGGEAAGRQAQPAGAVRRGLPQRHLPEGLPHQQQAGADSDHGSHVPRRQEPAARPRPHLVPGLPPHDATRQAERPFRRADQHRPVAAAVRQVPRRQAARLARRHPRQAHRRVHQHRQEALVHLHRVPQPAQRAGRRAQQGLHPAAARKLRRSCRTA